MLRLNFDKHNRCSALVKIAGSRMEEVELVVDTGATYVHLDNNKCQELGLTPICAVNISCIHGNNKSRIRYRGRIQIDDIPYAKNDVDIIGLIWEDKKEETIAKIIQTPKFMGVIGCNVLFDLKLHIEGKKRQGSIEP